MWILLRWPKMYGCHLRIPIAGLVSEMDTRFQHFTHGDCHEYVLRLRLSLHPRVRPGREPSAPGTLTGARMCEFLRPISWRPLSAAERIRHYISRHAALLKLASADAVPARCRRVSYRHSAAATETFRLSTLPEHRDAEPSGRSAPGSAAACLRPSAPSTQASGPLSRRPARLSWPASSRAHHLQPLLLEFHQGARQVGDGDERDGLRRAARDLGHGRVSGRPSGPWGPPPHARRARPPLAGRHPGCAGSVTPSRISSSASRPHDASTSSRLAARRTGSTRATTP